MIEAKRQANDTEQRWGRRAAITLIVIGAVGLLPPVAVAFVDPGEAVRRLVGLLFLLAMGGRILLPAERPPARIAGFLAAVLPLVLVFSIAERIATAR